MTISDDMQQRWAKALANESGRITRYFKALMLTGLRANELRKLPRSGWDGEAGVIHIASTKNGKPHSLATGTMLRMMLDEEARSTAADARLFDIPVKVYRAACERIGVSVGISWHLHDLRRTFATVATRAGVDAGMVKRLMNHSTSSDVTAHHCTKLNVEDMRPAMQSVESKVRAVSLRLSSEQAKRLTALASRHGMTRSEWLRNAIEQQMAAADAAIDSHAIYVDVTATLADVRRVPGSGRSDGAHQHSKVLKQKLHAGRRR